VIAVPFLTDPEQLRSFVTVPRVYKDVALHLPADFAINRFRSRLFGDVGAAGQVVSKKPTSAAVKLIFAVVFFHLWPEFDFHPQAARPGVLAMPRDGCHTHLLRGAGFVDRLCLVGAHPFYLTGINHVGGHVRDGQPSWVVHCKAVDVFAFAIANFAQPGPDWQLVGERDSLHFSYSFVELRDVAAPVLVEAISNRNDSGGRRANSFWGLPVHRTLLAITTALRKLIV